MHKNSDFTPIHIYALNPPIYASHKKRANSSGLSTNPCLTPVPQLNHFDNSSPFHTAANISSFILQRTFKNFHDTPFWLNLWNLLSINSIKVNKKTVPFSKSFILSHLILNRQKYCLSNPLNVHSSLPCDVRRITFLKDWKYQRSSTTLFYFPTFQNSSKKSAYTVVPNHLDRVNKNSTGILFFPNALLSFIIYLRRPGLPPPAQPDREVHFLGMIPHMENWPMPAFSLPSMKSGFQYSKQYRC